LVVLLVIVCTETFVPLTKLITHRARPIELYSGAEAFSFPSGHAAFAAVLYGMVAVIGSAEMSRRWKVATLAVAAALAGAIGLSRVYLSAHWPSDVVAGLLFGTAMTATFALLLRRRRWSQVRPVRLLVAAAAALAIAGCVHVTSSFGESLDRYAQRPRLMALRVGQWKAGGWPGVPRYRIDLVGMREEPFAFYATADPASLARGLQAVGWRVPPQWSLQDAGGVFLTTTDLLELPPLLRMHLGQLPVLTLVKVAGDGARRAVLRLWPTQYYAGDLPGHPHVLSGSLTLETVAHPLGLVTALRDRRVPWAAAMALLDDLAANPQLRMLSRAGEEPRLINPAARFPASSAPKSSGLHDPAPIELPAGIESTSRIRLPRPGSPEIVSHAASRTVPAGEEQRISQSLARPLSAIPALLP
jgi:PAP2 superfamily